MAQIEEQNIQSMEALLAHSSLGIHVLFDNKTIAEVLTHEPQTLEFASEEDVQRVQQAMMELVSRKTYWEKMSYLQTLESALYKMLLKAYFSIVENTVKESTELH